MKDLVIPRHGKRTHVVGGSDPIPYLGLYEIKIFRDDESPSSGNGKFRIEIPPDLDGWHLAFARAFVGTVGGSFNLQVSNQTTGFDMLSTSITIDSGEFSSKTGTDGVPHATHNVVADGDRIWIDCDSVGTGLGLGIMLRFEPPETYS